MECKNSALCIFDKPPTQTDIIKSYVSDYFPVTSITAGGPIEFHVPGNTEDYVDVNDIYLHVKFKVTKADGTAINAATSKMSVTNLAICSLFQDVSLTLGETQIEGGQQMYPYLGYINTVMQFHPAAQRTHMQLFGWQKDEASKFDSDTNTGFVKRQKWIEGSKECELYGPLFLDFTRQSRFLISQTDMRFRLLPSKPEFALNAYSAGDYKIKFTSVSLHVRRMLLNPSVINGHASGMTKHNAIYPLNHTELITFTIPRGQKSHVKDRLFPLQAPKVLVIGMVENAAFNGAYDKNPFHFQHFDLNKIALYREGESIPGRPFTPDFTKQHYARSYANTMQTFHYFNTDDTNGITYDEFGKGYLLYAYDLTADNDISASYRQSMTHNNLRLELSFAKDLTTTVNVLLFAVFDSHVEITKLRDVLTNYTR